MPRSLKRVCGHPGCPELTDRTYCHVHEMAAKKRVEGARESSFKRGYDARWRKARNAYLSDHPLCVRCLVEKFIVKATVLDHIIPHNGDPDLMWNKENWQSLCKRHHDQKTAKEDKRWG